MPTNGGPAGFDDFFITRAQGGKPGDGNQESNNSGTGQGGQGNGGSYWDPTAATPAVGTDGGVPVTPTLGLFNGWSSSKPAGLPTSFGAGGGGGNGGVGGAAEAGDGDTSVTAATSASNNSGAGGGGGGSASNTPGAGGSGLVVIRYIPASVAPDPASVTASSSVAGQVTLDITPGAGAGVDDSYIVQSDDGSVDYGTFSTTTVTLNSLQAGDNYTFRVAAVNSVGQSPGYVSSNTVTVATMTAPSNVASTPGPQAEQLTVSWDSPAQPFCSSSPWYQISFSSDNGANWTLPDVAFSSDPFIKTGLDVSLSYLARVAAYCPSPAALSQATPAATAVKPASISAPATVTAQTGSAADGPGTLQVTVTDGPGPAPARYVTQTSTDSGATWADDSTYDSSPFTITSLTPGQDYLVRVAAQTASLDDTSAFTETTNPAQARPGPPEAPVGLNAQPGTSAGSVTVQVQPGPGTVDAYQVQWSTDDSTNWTTLGTLTTNSDDSTITVTSQDGLSDDSTLYFRAYSVNALGDPSTQAAYTTTAVTVPSADAPQPDSIQVFRDDSTSILIDMTEQPPAGGRYLVQKSDDGGSTWTGDDTFATSPFTITGLTPTSPYTFRVAFTDSAGNTTSGFTTQPQDPIVPSTPDAPGITQVTPGATGLTVTCTAPTSLNGSTLQAPLFQYELNQSGTWTDAPSVNDTCGTFTVGSLTPGDSYAVRVRAVSNNGTGAASSSYSTTVGVPGVIDTASATVESANQSLIVTAPAPADNGSPITSVEYSVNLGGTWQTAQLADDNTVTIVGLTNGSDYLIRLRAVNARGAGEASDAFQGTPMWTPEAPTDVDAQATGATSAEVTFTLGDDNGSPITDVEYQLDGQGTWESAQTTTSPMVISGLAAGTTYSVQLRAVNGMGAGATSAQSEFTTVAPTPPPPPPLPSKPGVPASVNAEAGNATINVTWTAASAPTDAPVIAYRAVATPGGASCQAAADARSCTIDGLGNNVTYTVYVTAINAGGQGPAAVSNPVTTASAAPAAPGRPTAEAGNGQAVVSFTPAATGPAASHFTVTASPSGEQCQADSSDTQCVVTNLSNDMAYTFTVTANNAAGTSPASPASAPVTPRSDLPTPPAAPQQPQVATGDGQVTVTVTAGQGGGDADRFIVTAAPSGATCEMQATDTSCIVTGLDNGTYYTFTAQAKNDGGLSPLSPRSEPVAPKLAAPDAPTRVQALPGNGFITAVVTPADTGGTPSLMRVTASPGSSSCLAQSPRFTCVLPNLDPATEYVLSAQAVNSSGSSGSTQAQPVTPGPAVTPQPDPENTTLPAGTSTVTVDNRPVSGVTAQPNRKGTSLQFTDSSFTLTLTGVDNRGRTLGLQNRTTLILSDQGRARTSGTGFRPSSQATLFLFSPNPTAASAGSISLGSVPVDNLGNFAGNVTLPANLPSGVYTLQVAGVTMDNTQRVAALGVQIVDTNNVTITLEKQGDRERVNKRLVRVTVTGTTQGIPAGSTLTAQYRFGNSKNFRTGKARITVKDDGTFTWTRKIRKSRTVTMRVAFASDVSNQVRFNR